MFDKFFDSLRKATNPYKGFLGELWLIWKHNPGQAVLFARQYWQNIPEETVQQAAMAQQQAQAAQQASQINQQVNTQLGAMGIFPGSAGGGSFLGFGMNPDQAFFITTMGTIRAFQGDPPAYQEMVQLSEGVLRGQVDPVKAMIAATPSFFREQTAVAIQMLSLFGMGKMIKLQAIIQAASSLPRERISALLNEIEHK